MRDPGDPARIHAAGDGLRYAPDVSVLKGILHPQAGPIVPVILRQSASAEEITAFEAHGYALVDTGAALTGIDEDVAIRLKLPPAGTIQLNRAGPGQGFTASRFEGEIAFPGSRFAPVTGKLVGYAGLDCRHDDLTRVVAIIGRDVLTSCQLVIHAGRREIELQRLP